VLAARVEAKREQAAAEEAARKEKARKRKAVLKKLRRRAKQGQQAKPATLAEIADLLGSKSSHLGDIAALLGVDAAGVEKVSRASRKALGQKAASASEVLKQMGRHISASLGPVLAGLLNLFSFDDAPDPLGVLMLVLRNTSFTKRCFGEADLLSTLVGSIDGAEHLTQMKVRDSWRQLVRERERDRARGTLALAVRSSSRRGRSARKAFFSDVITIEKGSEVLVGTEGQARPHPIPSPQRARDGAEGADWNRDGRVSERGEQGLVQGEDARQRGGAQSRAPVRSACRYHPADRPRDRRGDRPWQALRRGTEREAGGEGGVPRGRSSWSAS